MVDGTVSILKAFPNIVVAEPPRKIPRIPPRELTIPASNTNCRIISFRLAPSAFRIPISFVRSVTETSIIFIIPIPATSNEILAIPTNIFVISPAC